jgi:glycosyltransferase involved in cell wall biosynthesis
MRILHLTNHCRFGHGNVHAAVDLACAQAAAGNDVFFVSEGGDFEDLLKQNGVQHFFLKEDRKTLFDYFAAMRGLKEILTLLRPEIVHAHVMRAALIGYAVTRLIRMRLVTTVHNSFDSHAVLMGLGDRVIAVSHAVAKQMAARWISTKRICVVHNGTVGAARRSDRSLIPADIARPSLATLCGLHDRKGVQDLVAAFDIVSKAHSSVHLYIIGEGPHEPKYIAQAQALDHGDRIHFLGQLRDPNPFLLSTDLFVLASHREPFGLAITEAREAGCAIAASNIDGIPEVLAVGQAGSTFPPQNPKAMAQTVLRLLNDPEALAISKAASARGMDYFHIDRVQRETQAVYLDALGLPNRQPIERST